MNTTLKRTKEFLIEKRNNILNGIVNCIPSPFKSLKRNFAGIQRNGIYLITGASGSGKSQFTNFTFLYNAIIYAYNNPDKAKVKVFYYTLEESEIEVTIRFISFLLYQYSKGTIRLAPNDLISLNEQQPLSQEILDLLETDPYKSILEFFNDNVFFREEATPTRIYKDLENYAKNNGVVHYKDVEYKDTFTGQIQTIKQFDYYVPDNKNEYVLYIVDHVSLIQEEPNKNLRESIQKLCDNATKLRNRYGYTAIFTQQQNKETQSLDAFKNTKIAPTFAGLADCTDTQRVATCAIGIVNTWAYGLANYYGYNTAKLGDNVRFIEIMKNRNGNSGVVKALFFEGDICNFKELPMPYGQDIEKYYTQASNNKTNISLSFLAITKKLSKKFSTLKEICNFVNSNN